MFLDKKILLKIRLNPGLNLTTFRGTGPRTFRDKKQQQRSRIFHSTQFNVYIGVDNRERARDRDKKQRRPISFEE